MDSPAKAFEMAAACHSNGQYYEAEAICRKILAVDPSHALTLHMLGILALQGGRPDQAVGLLQRAIAANPFLANFHVSLGETYRALGRTKDARDCFEHAIWLEKDLPAAHYHLALAHQAAGYRSGAIAELQITARLLPQLVEVHNELGNLLQADGQLTAAIAAFGQAQQLQPERAEISFNLANAWRAAGDLSRAEIWYRHALRLAPDLTAALNNLGTLCQARGELEQAERCFREAIRVEPQQAEAHYNLGILLEAQHEHDRAIASFEMSIAVRPDYAQVHFHLGKLYQRRCQWNEARACYEAALELEPSFPGVYERMAVMFVDTDFCDAALDACRRGLEQEPDSATVHSHMATALRNLGQLDEAIDHSRRALELRPDDVIAHSNLLYKLNFHPAYDAATIFGEHRAWAARHAEPLTAAAPAWPSVSSASGAPHRLRVGYVSPYFREHAVNFFTEPLITAHDSQRYEIFLYSDVTLPDATTQRLRAAADHWRDTLALSDAQLAQLVRQDQIDILVDLTGHIAGSRLLAFARRPAPVQVTYLGYQNTTGMSAMDYRLTDDWADPPGMTERFHTEQLIRLPGAFFCYRPTPEAPEVNPLPALEQGYVTFGAVNNFAKVTPQVIEAWLQILKRAENARLLLLARGGGSIERQFCQRAGQQGVDPARIEFCPKRPRPQYLELFGRIDIALDPFPFNGHTTTCDSLWMGVPVVMRAGTTYASRFGGSALKAVGLDDLITESTAAYVERAVQLAAHLEALAELRQELRPRMAASPLLDAQGFTRRLEDAYQALWNQRCLKP